MIRLSFVLIIYLFSYSIIWSQNDTDSSSTILNNKLIDAAYEGDYSKILDCLNKGAKINFTDEYGKSALIYVVEKNDLNLVKLLVDRGANINLIPNLNFGMPAIITSAKYGYFPISKYLIEKKANLNVRNKFGFSPLHFAALYNDTLLLEELLNNGANYNDTTNNGETPLLIAAYNGSLQALNYLINVGVDINTSDKYGFTPLMVSCQFGHIDIVYSLIQNWAVVNVKNNKGFTALSLAISNNFPEIVDLLCLNGAKRNEVNTLALNPRTLAKLYHYKTIDDSLKMAGMKTNLVPYFKGISTGVDMYLNNKDLLWGIDFRTIDIKSRVEIGLHYIFRPNAIPVLLHHGDTYFQYWERRHIIGLSASRKLGIIIAKDLTIGIEPTVLYELNLGNYRGTKEIIKEGFMVSPHINAFLQFKNTSYGIAYRYTSYNIEGLSNWYIGFSLHFSFLKSPPLFNKKMDGLD